MTLYEDVTHRLRRLIEEGVYFPGDRLPSVRKLAAEWRVSVSTVLEAYRRLESAGLIESRTRSGTYVSARQISDVALHPAPRPVEVRTFTKSSIAHQIMRDAANLSMVQFGAAIPAPDLLPAQKLQRTLAAVTRRAGADALRYDATPGYRPLCTEIVKRGVAADCDLSTDDIIVTNGCMEAVVLCLRALTQPGDTVAIEHPSYFGTLQALDSLGLRVLEIPCDREEGMNISALEFAMRHHAIKAIVVSANFANPLGSLMPEPTKERLVRLAARAGVPIIEDDLYGELHHGTVRPRPLKSFDEEGMVLWCSSFSKTLAPGWRIGWVAAGRFHDDVSHMKMCTNIACALPLEMALVEFLATGGYDQHLRKMRATLAKRVAHARAVIRESWPAGIEVTNPRGGTVLWVEFPAGIDTVAFYPEAIERGITFAPGISFSATGDLNHCLRINAAFMTDKTEGALRVLGELASVAMKEAETRRAG